MPVNYLKLQSQISAMGEQSVQRSLELHEKLERCRHLLQANAAELKLLQRLVEEAVSKDSGTRCAKPVTETLNAHLFAIADYPACTLLAVDGSQITPNAHEAVLFGLVNLGIFRFPLGYHESPSEETRSDLVYDDVLYSSGGMISEDLIALMRDVREREVLAELVEDELKVEKSSTLPVITLTDGPLELYHEPRTDKEFQTFFDRYLKAFDRLSLAEAVTAGYVDRPRADLVVRLLELLEPEPQANQQRGNRPFAGVTDLALFENLLQPGERSAVFELQSSAAKSFNGRKALHFFYLNVGREQQSALARVEIPAWVAQDAAALNLLHTVLVKMAHATGARPYPYPLIRAHEIAVVKMDDREQITRMVLQELANRGFGPLAKSNKQIGKENSPRTRL